MCVLKGRQSLGLVCTSVLPTSAEETWSLRVQHCKGLVCWNFRASLGYIANSRAAQAAWDPDWSCGVVMLCFILSFSTLYKTMAFQAVPCSRTLWGRKMNTAPGRLVKWSICLAQPTEDRLISDLFLGAEKESPYELIGVGWNFKVTCTHYSKVRPWKPGPRI